MNTKKPRLGRGLDALLDNDAEASGPKDQLRQLPVELLQRGKYQPRTHMNEEALAELASSIKTQGIVQPIVVRDLPNGGYEIIAGERRWRAAQIAGLATVPAIIRHIPDQAAMVIALIENIQREDLNPLEEATALQRLIDEFGMTHQQVAETVARSRATVTNLLRLLSLNSETRQLLEQNKIDMGHARALLALSGGVQATAARQIVEQGLSVRAAENLVRKLQGEGAAAKVSHPPVGLSSAIDADIRSLQEKLSDKLGARVSVRHHPKGTGQVVIDYNSVDELEGILSRIR